MKFLVLLLIITFIYLLFFKKREKRNSEKLDRDIEELYPCSKCETLVSKQDAIVCGNKIYCSKECAKSC
ncbi:MAG TPA: hypothetical protein EYO61_02890 [Campylobacterales bacterium]|nr:hypothetical protein [Campylobacterales bacterium]HIO71184.1 hypothetical protein [Campylobacterales bacterium]